MTEHAPTKVLIIEDDRDTRRAMRSVLEAGHCLVAESAHGDIGVELAKRFVPSVIVLDLLLPDMTGTEVLLELKQDILTADIPVIIVSVVRRQEAGIAAHAVAAHLVKPVAGDHLLETVRHVMALPLRARRLEDEHPA